jgi:hypothetical protein
MLRVCHYCKTKVSHAHLLIFPAASDAAGLLSSALHMLMNQTEEVKVLPTPIFQESCTPSPAGQNP